MKILRLLVALTLLTGLFSTCKKEEDPTYKVEFRITNNSIPLEVAYVCIDNHDTFITDEAGCCSIELPNGIYTYRVEKHPFTTLEKDFTVSKKDIIIEERLDTIQCTVTFNSNGGTAVEEQKVTFGQRAIKPEDPEKENYSFKFWTKENWSYDFRNSVIDNMTLVAAWAKIHNIVFMYDETTAIEFLKVIDGNKVTKPSSNPTRTGYKFAGWYVNNTLYNFWSPVTSDLKIVAKWLKIHTVNFDSNGGSAVASQYITEGDTIRKAEVKPIKVGFSLEGWYVDGVKFDFTTPIVKDLTLTAKWGYAVVFKFGKTDIVNFVIPPANTVVIPSNPTDSYSTFIRWFTRSATTGITDFTSSTIITSDTVVYAEWQMTDIDNNVYKAVTIGPDVWMAENLKTTKYNDGTAITLVESNETWAGLTSGAYCYYNNNTAYATNNYGALYNWYAVNTYKLCPTGWTVPDASRTPNYGYQWQSLREELIAHFGNNPGEYLKAETEWQAYSGVINRNTTGFSALPGGYRDYTGGFYFRGKEGYWWTSLKDYWSGSNNSFYNSLYYNNYYLNQITYSPKFGLSVRCVRK